MAHDTLRDDDLTELARELPPIMSTTEAARVLGVAPGTLRNRRCQGLPPASVRCGRRVRYMRAEVLRYLGADVVIDAEMGAHRVDCEWSDALTQLRQALEAFDSAALRRGRTFSTHLSRMVGSGKPLREQRLRDVEALRALARELSTAAADGYVATADGSERGLVVFGDAEGRDAARNRGSAC